MKGSLSRLQNKLLGLVLLAALASVVQLSKILSGVEFKLGFPTGQDFLVPWDNHYFFPMISCFRTSCSCFRTSFFCFCSFWENDFVPGHPGTEEFVPGFLLLLLSRNKGTAGQGNFFLSRDKGTVGQEIFFVPWKPLFKHMFMTY